MGAWRMEWSCEKTEYGMEQEKTHGMHARQAFMVGEAACEDGLRMWTFARHRENHGDGWIAIAVDI